MSEPKFSYAPTLDRKEMSTCGSIIPVDMNTFVGCPAVGTNGGQYAGCKLKDGKTIHEGYKNRLGQRIKYKVHQGLKVREDVWEKRGAAIDL